jgi:hypothetical protein
MLYGCWRIWWWCSKTFSTLHAVKLHSRKQNPFFKSYLSIVAANLGCCFASYTAISHNAKSAPFPSLIYMERSHHYPLTKIIFDTPISFFFCKFRAGWFVQMNKGISLVIKISLCI